MNPYARQVSMFHFLMAGNCNRPSPPISCKERMFPVRGDWLKDPAQAVPKFRSWLLALRHKFPPGSKKSYLFGSYSHGNARNSWFNASQLSWFVDASGKLLVQKVLPPLPPPYPPPTPPTHSDVLGASFLDADIKATSFERPTQCRAIETRAATKPAVE